ncbi:hypothetical protein [Halobellus rarus]|uniref:ArsR family transcriptional regulator n=1 Tax=Halobellus rarus TaxID=1126237 RepID=A0ABD6CIL3_9EURY|nr:hypothetical protein [Halobellus rarus]
MRIIAQWMSKWDGLILEHLYEKGPSAPADIAAHDHVYVGAAYISQRLTEMAEHGLVERPRRGTYTITKAGKYYLAGGYDPINDEFLHEIDSEEGIYNYKRMGIIMRDLADKFRNE